MLEKTETGSPVAEMTAAGHVLKEIRVEGGTLMDDIFYDIENLNLTKIRNILLWAHKNAMRTDVDMLDCRLGPARRTSDKSFEEVMKHLDKRSVVFFRLIKRSDRFAEIEGFEKDEFIEVFIRSIDIDSVEYFIFIYLKKDKLDWFKKKFTLKALN